MIEGKTSGDMKMEQERTEDDESMEIIESLIRDEREQMSGLIQQGLKNVESYYFANFCKAVLFVEALGWYEHTCDWDLCIVFEMKDGTSISTEEGYDEISMENGYFIVKGPDKLDDDTYKACFENGMWKVPITDVRTLTLVR